MKLLLLLLLPLVGFAQPELEKRSLLDGKVELMVPKDLAEMSGQLWTMKYGSTPRPVLALTDVDGEANLLADMTGQAASEEQLTAYKEFRMQHLTKNRTDVEFLGNGMKTVNGKKIGFFKFLSSATDQKVFNYYFFLVVDGKILFFTFNCPARLRRTWEKIADAIVGSVVVK